MSVTNGDWDDRPVKRFSGSAGQFRELVPGIFMGIGFNGIHIEDLSRRAYAFKERKFQNIPKTGQSTAEIRWYEAGDSKDRLLVKWNVFDNSRNRRPLFELAENLGESIGTEIRNWRPPRPEQPKGDIGRMGSAGTIIGPGEPFDGIYEGTLRDYSGCATINELGDLNNGTLPLGRHVFGFNPPASHNGRRLFLGRFRTGASMEYNGVLVCAPQNSGKTMLIERWAQAATTASRPYAVFVVDVKGNLRAKLQRRNLKGEVFCFSTDPHDQSSDRINFLDGPMGLDAAESDRIRQIVTALLPSRGFTEKGGIDEYHYRNRVIWLTAFVHLLKLKQCYYPERVTDDRGRERNVDLADLYELIADEKAVYRLIDDLHDAEQVVRKRGDITPVCGAEHWATELAILLNPNFPERRIKIGQRPERDSFGIYTTALLSALEPFSAHGTLHHRIRSFGPGRLFDLETALSGARRPISVILTARQQDLEKSDVVLALAIKRLQWLLFDRMQQPDAKDRPLLILLDETRRIRDFNAPDYVAFAREAKAACVIVYQALDQIGEPSQITALLENVGTQIYLGSLVGNTAKYFLGILPKRQRRIVTYQEVRQVNTKSRTDVIGREQVDFFSTFDLYNLPAGAWPALIYINDQPRRKPFLCDMSETEVS